MSHFEKYAKSALSKEYKQEFSGRGIKTEYGASWLLYSYSKGKMSKFRERIYPDHTAARQPKAFGIVCFALIVSGSDKC